MLNAYLDFKDGSRFDATTEYLYIKKIEKMEGLIFIAMTALKYYSDISLDPDIAIQAKMKIEEIENASNTQE